MPPAPAPPASQLLLHSLLQTRNEEEILPFRRIIESYTQLARQNHALKLHLDHKEKELVILRHEAIEAHHPPGGPGGAGGGGGGGGGGGAASHTADSKDDRYAKLQRKCQRLQEELTDKLRLEVQGTTSQLNMSKEIQDMFQKWQAARGETETLRTELEGFKEREPALVAKAAMATTDLEVVTSELARQREMAEKLEKECRELRTQNEELIQRIVGEKSRNAEEMNRMTELVEQMRAQLKAQGIHVGSGAGPSSSFSTADFQAPSSSSPSPQPTDELPSHLGPQFKAHATDVNDLAYNETGSLLATSGSDGKVRVWEAGTGRLKATLQGADVMLGLDLRGDFVVAGSSDHTCKMWNVSSERNHRTFVGHSGNVYAVKVVAGDGRAILTGAADRTIRLWDVGKASCRQVLRSGSTCNGLDIGMDGNVPVSAHQDGGLRVWDLRSGNPTMIVRAFETQATSVSYGSNFMMVANSRDNVIKVIDTRTFETLQIMRHEDYRTFLNWSKACFSPSNAYVGAGSANGQVFVWEVATGEVKAMLSAATATAAGGGGGGATTITHSSSLSASSSSSSGAGGGVTNCVWGWGGISGMSGSSSSGNSRIRLATCTKGGYVQCWE